MALQIPQAPQSSGDALRSRLSMLQGKLRAALADKKSRIQNIIAICKTERRAMRQELRDKRAQALKQIEFEIDALRASARSLRLSRLVETRKSVDSDIAAARAAIAVERAHQDELRRIAADHRRRRAEVHRLHEVAAQSGALHTHLLGPFATIVQKVGAKVKPVPGESRAEAILRHVQTHPEEAHAAAEPAVERVIKETQEAITKTKAALRSAPRLPKERLGVRRPPATPRASAPSLPARKKPVFSPLAIRPLYESEGRGTFKPVAPKAAKPVGPTAKPTKAPPGRKPGQLPRGGGGMPLEELLRERDALSAKGTKKPGAARGAGRPAAPRAKRSPKEKKGGPPPPPPLGRPGVPSLPAANQVVRERTEKTVKAPDVHDTAALAKLIRQDIQTAVTSGELPRAKYSVTTDKYSMGSSITVVAAKLPFPVLDAKAFAMTKWGPEFDREHFRSRYTPEAESLQQKLETIVGAYHWDRSDPMTDYYNERFHKDIRLDDRGEMDRIRSTLSGKTRAPEADAPFTWKEPPGGLLEPGWYASDEARGRRGPFDSQAKAEKS